MAIFSVPQRARLVFLTDLLAGNYDRPLDATVVEQLANIFDGTLGFRCACGVRGPSLRQSFLDEPITTFLQLLAAISVPGTVVESPVPALAGVGPSPVELGTATNFDVLAATTVTNTGGSVLQNDLGLSPGTAVTGFPPGTVLGTQHVTDGAAANAQLDLTTAYLDAAGRTDGAITISANMAGTTLTPGLYKSATTLDVTSGNLTLDAQGNSASTWIFQAGTALNIGNSAQIILTGGARAENITWKVGSSATIGTSAIFKGTILALTSITANTSATIEGRLLARNGAVTLDTNAIVIPPEAAPEPAPTTPLPVITDTQRTQIQAIIDYLKGNINLPLDSRIVEALDRIFGGTSGFPCACGIQGVDLRSSLRDEPYRTLIRLLIAVSDATVGA